MTDIGLFMIVSIAEGIMAGAFAGVPVVIRMMMLAGETVGLESR